MSGADETNLMTKAGWFESDESGRKPEIHSLAIGVRTASAATVAVTEVGNLSDREVLHLFLCQPELIQPIINTAYGK